MVMVSQQNPATLEEISDLALSGSETKLEALLGSRMTFGTAGKSSL